MFFFNVDFEFFAVISEFCSVDFELISVDFEFFAVIMKIFNVFMGVFNEIIKICCKFAGVITGIRKFITEIRKLITEIDNWNTVIGKKNTEKHNLIAGKMNVNAQKKNINTLFDRIAYRYDFINHALTLNIDRYWRKKTIQKIDGVSQNLLDVATGTADLSIEIIKQRKAQNIVAIDVSNNMIQIAKNKLRNFINSNQPNYNSINCSFICADVHNLPFHDNQFSTVTCSFGTRNFENLQQGINEIYRVTNHSGQVIILEFAYPKNRLFRLIYSIYFTHILPRVGKILSHDNNAYKYLIKSIKEFPKDSDFLTYLSSAGFKDTHYEHLSCGIVAIYTAKKI